MTTPIRTVLFDLDGTLADTLPDLAAALNATLKAAGLAPIPAETLRPWITEGGRAMVDRAVGEALDAQTRDRLRHDFLNTYAANIAQQTRLFPEIDEVLVALESRDMRWGIVTNKLAAFTRPLVRALGLDQRAACIVSGDTTAHPKPHPEPLIFACRSAGSVPRECLYFGDAEKDVLAGRRAGMRTVIALYGYIDAGADPHSWGANATVDSPKGLLRWLDQQP